MNKLIIIFIYLMGFIWGGGVSLLLFMFFFQKYIDHR